MLYVEKKTTIRSKTHIYNARRNKSYRCISSKRILKEIAKSGRLVLKKTKSTVINKTCNIKDWKY